MAHSDARHNGNSHQTVIAYSRNHKQISTIDHNKLSLATGRSKTLIFLSFWNCSFHWLPKNTKKNQRMPNHTKFWHPKMSTVLQKKSWWERKTTKRHPKILKKKTWNMRLSQDQEPTPNWFIKRDIPNPKLDQGGENQKQFSRPDHTWDLQKVKVNPKKVRNSFFFTCGLDWRIFLLSKMPHKDNGPKRTTFGHTTCVWLAGENVFWQCARLAN